MDCDSENSVALVTLREIVYGVRLFLWKRILGKVLKVDHWLLVFICLAKEDLICKSSFAKQMWKERNKVVI